VAAIDRPDAIRAINKWAWMENGFLPRAGGVDDQLEMDIAEIEIVAAAYAAYQRSQR